VDETTITKIADDIVHLRDALLTRELPVAEIGPVLAACALGIVIFETENAL
jgi:hypothetical protein